MIHLGWDERVAVVTIDRQERRNAVDVEALGGIRGAVASALDDGAGALVLTGAGGHFCAGADLTTLEDAGFTVVLREVLDLLAGAPIVTIAAVQGAALGLGTQLATSCDLRVAAADARFGIPAAKLGLMVDARTMQRLVSLAGDGPARAMLLAAEQVDGEAAHRLGLVQRLGTTADAVAWAREICALAPLTIAGTKAVLDRLQPPPPDDPVVTAAFERAWRSADLVEGQAAFRERRSPRFRGE